MAEPTTQRTKASVAAYLDAIPDPAERKDAKGLTALKADPALLKRLGRHRVGGGCLYLPSLGDVDAAVLIKLVSKSYQLNTGVTPG